MGDPNDNDGKLPTQIDIDKRFEDGVMVPGPFTITDGLFAIDNFGVDTNGDGVVDGDTTNTIYNDPWFNKENFRTILPTDLYGISFDEITRNYISIDVLNQYDNDPIFYYEFKEAKNTEGTIYVTIRIDNSWVDGTLQKNQIVYEGLIDCLGKDTDNNGEIDAVSGTKINIKQTESPIQSPESFLVDTIILNPELLRQYFDLTIENPVEKSVDDIKYDFFIKDYDLGTGDITITVFPLKYWNAGEFIVQEQNRGNLKLSKDITLVGFGYDLDSDGEADNNKTTKLKNENLSFNINSVDLNFLDPDHNLIPSDIINSSESMSNLKQILTSNSYLDSNSVIEDQFKVNNFYDNVIWNDENLVFDNSKGSITFNITLKKSFLKGKTQDDAFTFAFTISGFNKTKSFAWNDNVEQTSDEDGKDYFEYKLTDLDKAILKSVGIGTTSYNQNKTLIQK